MSDARNHLAERFRWQARWCDRLGSKLYAALLVPVAENLAGGGPIWSVVEPQAEAPDDDAVPLRFMGAVHRLVLRGDAPDLARFYPSAGGTERGDAWPAFRATVEANVDELRELALRPVQTNEVGRSGALVGGFLQVAKETGLPLRILETGASAGLNLRWDRFRYEARGATWGPTDSPVRLCDYNSERPLPFDVVAEVIGRAGCDINPLDPRRDEDRQTLLAYVWPDQVARIRLLRAALDVAQRVPADVEKATAAAWLEERLAEDSVGVATVVYHSIFFQYMSGDEAQRFETVLNEAGARATSEAPLAWLRLEPGGEQAKVRLTMWPGGEERLLATSGFHGAAVRWLH
ncbi:MAG: DUF2332 domain-containing protein [Actinomycetota bacterium]